MRTFLNKTKILIFFLGIIVLSELSGCRTTQSTLKVSNNLKASKVLTLSMPMGKDGDNGYNGAGVVFHPEFNQWYAVFAGNPYFPLAVFNANGKMLKNELTAQYDARGFWYNDKAKTIEGNSFDDGGIIQYKLDSKGIPESYDEIFRGGSHQPDANAVGVYDNKNDEILYFFDGEIQRYDRKNAEKIGTYGLKGDLNPYEFNETSIIYTGYKGGEIGLLSYSKHKVILFDKGSGNQTGTITLPENAPAPDRFNFSFSAGKIWLFDTETRNWYGYEVK
ncbi:MAG: hypothetical protein K1X92_05545 [Bacteroidia bacterium]|nr:hypothetical protein [Bacteroidia bacterium]